MIISLLHFYQARCLLIQGHLIAYVNAWEDDHASDPLLVVISEIDTVIQPYLEKNKPWKTTWDTVKKSGLEIVATGAKHIIIKGTSKILGNGIDEISGILETNAQSDTEKDKDYSDDASAILKPLDQKLEKLLTNFRKQKNSEKLFGENLKKFLTLVEDEKKIKLPFFILIDELDRCRPTYAVEMLERIKHLFNIPNIVFILATDTSQLRHVVRGVYGSGFDSTRYLLRFFDRTYMFKEPDTHTFVKYLFDVNKIETQRLLSPMDTDSIELFSKMMLYFELGLRDIEQCFEIFHDFYTGWQKNKKIHLAYLLPLICTFHQRKHEYLNILSTPNEVDIHSNDHANLNELGNKKIELTYTKYAGEIPHEKKINASKSFTEVIGTYILNLHKTKRSLLLTLRQGGATCTFSYWFASNLIIGLDLMDDGQEENDSIYLHHELRHYPQLVKSAGRLTFQPKEEA